MIYSTEIGTVTPMDKMPVVPIEGFSEVKLAIAFVPCGNSLYFLTPNPHTNEFGTELVSSVKLASPQEQIDSQERINKERQEAMGGRGRLVVPQQEILVPNR